MKTITFYSYKGGVGRSLALSNIAIRLSELKKKVCVLDFDLEAPGLQFKFNNYTKSKQIEKGIVDYIDEFSSKGVVPKKIEDYAVQLSPSNKNFAKIDFIPAGDIDNPQYWKKLSCVNWSKMFYEEDSKGVQFFLDLKRKIETELKPDFLLIDSRTGITDIAGITLKLLADEAVILAANNQENIYGSKKIIRGLIDKDNLLFGKTPKVTFILTRLPYTDTPQDKGKEFSIIERKTIEFRNELSIPDFKILVIHSDRRLEENERTLIGDDYEEKSVSISNDYLKLFDEVTNNLLSKDEIIILQNNKVAAKEFKNGLIEKDKTKKIVHFTKAIELENTQADYYFERGKIYEELKELDNAQTDYSTALTLSPDSTEILNYMASLYAEKNLFKESLVCIESAIQKNKKGWYPYYLKAWIFQKEKDFNQAFITINYLLTHIDPNNQDGLNIRANIFRLTNEYEKAYQDIFRAIEINPNQPIYFATLAEIYASDEKINEFYLNLNIALSKGVSAVDFRDAKDVYQKFINEEKFILLMEKYSIDINDIFSEDSK